VIWWFTKIVSRIGGRMPRAWCGRIAAGEVSVVLLCHARVPPKEILEILRKFDTANRVSRATR